MDKSPVDQSEVVRANINLAIEQKLPPEIRRFIQRKDISIDQAGISVSIAFCQKNITFMYDCVVTASGERAEETIFVSLDEMLMVVRKGNSQKRKRNQRK